MASKQTTQSEQIAEDNKGITIFDENLVQKTTIQGDDIGIVSDVASWSQSEIIVASEKGLFRVAFQPHGKYDE